MSSSYIFFHKWLLFFVLPSHTTQKTCLLLSHKLAEHASFLPRQLQIASFLHNFSSINHNNYICIPDCAQPVSDCHNTSAAHYPLQSHLHLIFACRVQGRGCLVKKQKAWLLDDCPCNGYPLFLSPTQHYPPLTNKGVITLRKGHDEVMSICLLCCSFQVFLGDFFRLRSSIQDVVSYAGGEEDGFLADCPNVGPNKGGVKVSDVLAIQTDFARIWGVQT